LRALQFFSFNNQVRVQNTNHLAFWKDSFYSNIGSSGRERKLGILKIENFNKFNPTQNNILKIIGTSFGDKDLEGKIRFDCLRIT